MTMNLVKPTPYIMYDNIRDFYARKPGDDTVYRVMGISEGMEKDYVTMFPVGGGNLEVQERDNLELLVEGK